MGFARIRHEIRGIEIELPYIALHFLQHGCLAYRGEIHVGRSELLTLKAILDPVDPAHLSEPHEPDGDHDGLIDLELGLGLAKLLAAILDRIGGHLGDDLEGGNRKGGKCVFGAHVGLFWPVPPASYVTTTLV